MGRHVERFNSGGAGPPRNAIKGEEILLDRHLTRVGPFPRRAMSNVGVVIDLAVHGHRL